ncbi:MAG: nitroreductase family deazaflavin-dependent oxidoreductase [Anaerolineales bacterium]|nr:nitroreductase family deazaflavin-dependent oxidoreductase [Anaerolineales bacterium]
MTTRSANWNESIIEEFRAHAGIVGGRFAGRTLLLLHHTGAKSGAPRLNPVAYVRDGENLIIIASKSGAPTNPDWLYNLQAHPDVTVEVGTQTLPVRARIVTAEPERSRLYAKMVAVFPGFADYEKNTTRKIPAVVLSPR